MNRADRIKMVKAMEFIARQINDEDVFYGWLYAGVADGEIEYGDFSVEEGESDAEFYIEDGEFAELMDTFMRMMRRAYNSGGLYCDGIVSKADAS